MATCGAMSVIPDPAPRPLAQRLGAVLWPSFFAAGVATMVFFAFIDPLQLRDMTFPDIAIGRGVGYSIDSRMKSRLAVDALASAVARGGQVAGCILHTDRGSHFRSRKFVHALHRHDMGGSMGKVGAAGDNAAMESFFSLLQKNVLDRQRWLSRQDLRLAITTWIERTYHRRRRQRRLGKLTPIEYETINRTALTAA